MANISTDSKLHEGRDHIFLACHSISNDCNSKNTQKKSFEGRKGQLHKLFPTQNPEVLLNQSQSKHYPELSVMAHTYNPST
jgi:hypothetical protein